MKRSQSTLFVVVGLILFIIMGFFIFTSSINGQALLEQHQKNTFADKGMKTGIETEINSCIDYAVKETISETGIREETLKAYEKEIASKITSCMSPSLKQREDQGYTLKSGTVSVDAEINPETIILDIDYPIKFEKDALVIEIKKFHHSFDRSNTVNIDGGITGSEIRLISTNGKAELKIPEGVKITDKNGKPVEKIGMKVLDLHFDGLSNGVILGELAYENFPDKTTFSSPVEMTIEFDENEIPPGYTKENLRIAYWDEKNGIWYAPPTNIHGNLATANITHFSTYATAFGGPNLVQTLVFKQRFEPIAGGPIGSKTGAWEIGGEPGSNLGSVTFQPGFTSFDDLKAVYGEKFKDFRGERENAKSEFISFNNLRYGYFLNPSKPNDAEFIDAEIYDSKNIEGINYYLEGNYPMFVDKKTGETKPGWHNLQSAGGRIRPADGEAASEFLVFRPKGDSVLAISGQSSEAKPYLHPYAYPMEDTISFDNNLPGKLKNNDFKYPFYCAIKQFPDEKDTEKITLSDSSLGVLRERGLDLGEAYSVYGIYGINAFKRTDNFLSRSQMHVQCEVFWYFWGNGLAYSNTPAENVYQGADIKLWMEYIGAKVLKEVN